MRFTDIGKATGVRCILSSEEEKLIFNLTRKHIDLMPKVYRKRNENWIIVKNLTNNGCGYSIAICKALGVDPFSKKWEKDNSVIIKTKVRHKL